ncbi:MAG: zinc ribbon domain-containing protein [Lachnospiraceae bacterium]|nr:zinc ribbon domain-containing protein [Lachnospiraceae bacterium]
MNAVLFVVVPLIILAILTLVIIVIISNFIKKAKRIARQGFGTDNLEAILKQQELLDEEPKSISGMTSIYLPKLQKDFPELNWMQLQNTAKQHLVKFLEDKGFAKVKIHKNSLYEYKKESGTCYATIQHAVEYVKPDEKKVQTRFNVIMSYVQDAEKMGYEKAYAVTCPNCGAAITSLGAKTCEYCGSAIQPYNIRVWELSDIIEC